MATVHRSAIVQRRTVFEPEELRNLSVNYIPTSIDEFELRDMFAQYGSIERLKIFMDRRTRSSHGHGFVQYRTAKGAVDAIKQLNGYSIGKKRLQVAYAKEAEAQQALTELIKRREQLQKLCRDFTPLGGNRPDAAVVACAAMELYIGRLRRNVIVAPDVLDTALGILCAPLIINYARDLWCQQDCFRYPAVSVRLRTTDPIVVDSLLTAIPSVCMLSLAVQLDRSVEALPDDFMKSWECLKSIDFRRTAIRCVGKMFLFRCTNLTSIELPESLSEMGDGFLAQCELLTRVDLRHTAIQRVGNSFLYECRGLTTVELPESVTEVGHAFLQDCAALDSVHLRHTSIETVGDGFLDSCGSLTSAELPDSLTEIGYDFLGGCWRMKCIILSRTVIDKYHAILGRRSCAYRWPKSVKDCLRKSAT